MLCVALRNRVDLTGGMAKLTIMISNMMVHQNCQDTTDTYDALMQTDTEPVNTEQYGEISHYCYDQQLLFTATKSDY